MLPSPDAVKIETEPSFDRNWYRVQTVLQFLLAATIVGGLTGLFGGGWLSSKVVRIGQVEVTYDRFVRKSVPFRIVLRSIDFETTQPIEVTLGRSLTEKIAIIRTIPTAVSSRETVDGIKFAFASDSASSRIAISVQPDSFGLFSWNLSIGGAGEASLFQIIYP